MYVLNNQFARNQHFEVMVAGCGGTGGFAAEGLCRVLPANADLVLIDFDRVEEGNLVRQNFFSDEIGEVKSKALADRLARKYRRAVAYSTYPIAMTELTTSGIIIGCVDNGLARRDIAAHFKGSHTYPLIYWWIDAGVGDNYGQILIGNDKEAAFQEKDELCLALPLPTIQRPELLAQVPDARRCVAVPLQGPTINQTVASLLVEVVRRVIEGTCSWMQLLLEMQTGEMHPVMATPETAGRIIGKSKVQIIKEKGGAQ